MNPDLSPQIILYQLVQGHPEEFKAPLQDKDALPMLKHLCA